MRVRISRLKEARKRARVAKICHIGCFLQRWIHAIPVSGVAPVLGWRNGVLTYIPGFGGCARQPKSWAREDEVAVDKLRSEVSGIV
jgi:hypothetical protein